MNYFALIGDIIDSKKIDNYYQVQKTLEACLNELNIKFKDVLITKPTNVFFKIFFQKYQPESSQKMDTIPGAGATIGLLERIVCDEYLYHFQSIRLNRTCFYC